MTIIEALEFDLPLMIGKFQFAAGSLQKWSTNGTLQAVILYPAGCCSSPLSSLQCEGHSSRSEIAIALSNMGNYTKSLI